MVTVVYPMVSFIHFCSDCNVFLDEPANDVRFSYVCHRSHNRKLGRVAKMRWVPFRQLPTKAEIGSKENPLIKVEKNT